MKKIIISVLLLNLIFNIGYAQASTKPINIKNNKSICNSIKTKYESEIMSKWVNGLKSDNDVLNEIESNIKMISDKRKKTNGKLNKVILLWINAEKNTKDALIDKDVEKITNAMNDKIKAIIEFDKICKSIQK